MKPLGLTQAALANNLHVPVSQISAIVREKRGLNADMALRLGHYFGMTPDFWMNLQSHYELESAKDIVGKRIMREVQPGPHLKSKTQQEPA
jgi:addiction module HigA family antidote